MVSEMAQVVGISGKCKCYKPESPVSSWPQRSRRIDKKNALCVCVCVCKGRRERGFDGDQRAVSVRREKKGDRADDNRRQECPVLRIPEQQQRSSLVFGSGRAATI
jgi:hypothetical protein